MTEHISWIFQSTFFVDFAQVNVYCYGFHNFKLKLSSMKNMGAKQESQLPFTCSKSTIETLEKAVKYVWS